MACKINGILLNNTSSCISLFGPLAQPVCILRCDDVRGLQLLPHLRHHWRRLGQDAIALNTSSPAGCPLICVTYLERCPSAPTSVSHEARSPSIASIRPLFRKTMPFPRGSVCPWRLFAWRIEMSVLLHTLIGCPSAAASVLYGSLLLFITYICGAGFVTSASVSSRLSREL